MRDVSFYDRLYPLQDAVLRTLRSVSALYLTGGTAISRCYYDHRFSEDLDFFMNHSAVFREEAQKMVNALRSDYSDVQVIMDMDTFLRIFVTDQNGTVLKIELVNDVGYRYGTPIDHERYHLVDIPRNILSNKLCALSRNAPKDVSDIIAICQHESFSWPDLFEEAKLKDTWANELSAINTLSNMAMDELVTKVDWTEDPDPIALEEAISIICTDIAKARENSLYRRSLNK